MIFDRTSLIAWTARAGSFAALLGVLLPTTTLADDVPLAKEEQAIRSAAKAYLAGLAKGDSKVVAECWAADGEYIDETGKAHPASELMAESRQSVAAAAVAETRVTASKIRFLTPEVAVEDGSSEVVWPEGNVPPARGHFHATWVKQDGRWRLARLCEISNAPPAAPDVADLDWMVGTWTAESGDDTLEATVRWEDSGMFLLRDTKAIRDGQVLLRGTHRIGLDRQTGRLKSWSFDSEGGHAEGVWTKDGDSWVEQASGVLPDGRAVTATAVITFDGKDSFMRDLVAAQIEGQAVPDQKVQFRRHSDRQP